MEAKQPTPVAWPLWDESFWDLSTSKFSPIPLLGASRSSIISLKLLNSLAARPLVLFLSCSLLLTRRRLRYDILPCNELPSRHRNRTVRYTRLVQLQWLLRLLKDQQSSVLRPDRFYAIYRKLLRVLGWTSRAFKRPKLYTYQSHETIASIA